MALSNFSNHEKNKEKWKNKEILLLWGGETNINQSMQYDVTIKILSLWRCWKIWVNGKLVNCELSTEINDQHMATTTTSKSFHRRDSYWSGGGHLVVIFSSKLRCITSLSRFLGSSQ